MNSIIKSSIDYASSGIVLEVSNIEACNLIQGTNGLYKLRVNFKYDNGISKESEFTDVVYVLNVNDKYKIVGGQFLSDMITNLMYQQYYGY